MCIIDLKGQILYKALLKKMKRDIFWNSITAAVQRNIEGVDIFINRSVALAYGLQPLETNAFPVRRTKICKHLNTQAVPLDG